MFTSLNRPKFVLTLKPKQQNVPKHQNELKHQNDLKHQNNTIQILPYDMLNYIATFINTDDVYTWLSYLIVFPGAIYEVRKKIIEYLKVNKVNKFDKEFAPNCIYRFMNEPIRILSSTLIPIFGVYKLLRYCINENENKILKRPNGRRFIIYLIKEQNKVPQKEIYKILDENNSHHKTMHYNFNTLDILRNTEIAKLSKNISCCEIDNYIHKKLQLYLCKNKNSDLKSLSINEKALLMQYNEKDSNYNYKLHGIINLIDLLLIEIFKSNNFKLLDILFENDKIKLFHFVDDYTEINNYICNLKIDSEEFNKSRKIIKYYLEKIIEISCYKNLICNMINLSYEIENYNMVKFLLSLNGAREGISELVSDRYISYCVFSRLSNQSKDESVNLEYQKTFTNDLDECKKFILCDFLINNIPNDLGFDINIVNDNMLGKLSNGILIYTDFPDKNCYTKYLYIINKHIKYFDCSKGYENPNEKYHCNRETLINMYKILLLPIECYINLKIILLKEFEELLLNSEDNSEDNTTKITNDMIRELIKNIYYKILKHNQHIININNMISKANLIIISLDKHREIDNLIKYLIKIPEFIMEYDKFRKVIKIKLDEILNDTTVNESYIETYIMMQSIRQLNEIIQGMGMDESK